MLQHNMVKKEDKYCSDLPAEHLQEGLPLKVFPSQQPITSKPFNQWMKIIFVEKIEF